MEIEAALAVTDSLVFAQTGKHLNTLQTAIFRGAWLGQKYEEIAEANYCSNSHVKMIGATLWDILSESLAEKITKKNFRAVLERREREELKTDEIGSSETAGLGGAREPITPIQQDWGEAIDVSVFYGRISELATLEKWIQVDRCRLMGVLGMGGIGKTALSVKLAQQLQEHFEYLIWRMPVAALMRRLSFGMSRRVSA